jgi:hypothetical protein
MIWEGVLNAVDTAIEEIKVLMNKYPEYGVVYQQAEARDALEKTSCPNYGQ